VYLRVSACVITPESSHAIYSERDRCCIPCKLYTCSTCLDTVVREKTVSTHVSSLLPVLSRLASFGPASEVSAMSQDSEGGGDGGAGGNVLSVDGTGVWRAVDELARLAGGDDGALGEGFLSRANPNNAEGLDNNFWRGQVGCFKKRWWFVPEVSRN
jgi:hypothetical protein